MAELSCCILQECFKYPVLSDDLKKAGKLFKCKETDAEFEPKKLTLQKLDVKLVGCVSHFIF